MRRSCAGRYHPSYGIPEAVMLSYVWLRCRNVVDVEEVFRRREDGLPRRDTFVKDPPCNPWLLWHDLVHWACSTVQYCTMVLQYCTIICTVASNPQALPTVAMEEEMCLHLSYSTLRYLLLLCCAPTVLHVQCSTVQYRTFPHVFHTLLLQYCTVLYFCIVRRHAPMIPL